MTYTLTNADELNGTITNDGANVNLNGTFTQKDIIDNHVKYTPNPTFSGWAKFDFKVTHLGDHKDVNSQFNIIVNSTTDGGGMAVTHIFNQLTEVYIKYL